MVECIFTLDYEIYGNGQGSLEELVHTPAKALITLFEKSRVPLVAFVEAAELRAIEAKGTDKAIDAVRRQIREMRQKGCEIALHLHPQWCNARYERGRWLLDECEVNLGTLKRERIEQIVRHGIEYLRYALEDTRFNPLSFRAGNWLFQPTRTVAWVLAANGLRIDSSVFKGGLQRNQKLDYRPALGNGNFWKFSNDVNVSEPEGMLLEIPTHSVMVPCWRMLTGKRLRLQRKSPSDNGLSLRQKVNNYLDKSRPRYPLKFDFCRMTLKELIATVQDVVAEDQQYPEAYRPLVAIGHTKDLIDCATVEAFLRYLKEKGIAVINLQDALSKCLTEERQRASLKRQSLAVGSK
jgi:hypothetical protein